MVLHISLIIIRADSLVSELRNASIEHKFPKPSDEGFRHHYDSHVQMTKLYVRERSAGSLPEQRVAIGPNDENKIVQHGFMW